ncbi:MAG: DUF4955 domain-containing protein [Verrucomicrobiota bacterium]
MKRSLHGGPPVIPGKRLRWLACVGWLLLGPGGSLVSGESIAVLLDQQRRALGLTGNLGRDFVSALQEGRETPIPDFSYVGYHLGEKAVPEEGAFEVNRRFPVTDFGARPNDGQDDQAGVQAAIDAATAHGGGVVFFPPGVFHFRTDPLAPREPLRVRHSHIVLKGSGVGPAGTILHLVHDNWDGPSQANRTAQNGSPYYGMLQNEGEPFLHFLGDPTSGPSFGKLAAPALRPTRELIFEDVDGLQAGDFVAIQYETDAPSARDYLIYGLPTQPEWGLSQKATLREFHEVESVEGTRVTLRSGLFTSLQPEWGVRLRKGAHLRECGVEDLTFLGAWVGQFSHHRSMMDNTGWRFVVASGVRDFWMRRVHAINGTALLLAEHSARLSLYQLRHFGSVAHNGPKAGRSTGTFIGHFFDESDGLLHPLGAGYHHVGLVLWRSRLHPERGFDFHGKYSVASLMDRIEGGGLFDSGGPSNAFPHHGRDMVFWNFFFSPEYEKRPKENSLWGPRPSFAAPFVVGLHGQDIPLSPEMTMTNEGQGQRVAPESLYEAQLAYRLQRTPAWLETLKRQKTAFLAAAPIPFFRSGQDRRNPHRFVQSFPLRHLAWQVAGLSGLRGGNLVQLKGEEPAADLRAETDFVMLRQLLWCLGHYAEGFTLRKEDPRQTSSGNEISFERDEARRLTRVTLHLAQPAPTGFLKKAASRQTLAWKEFQSAENLAAALEARLDYQEGEDTIRITVPDLPRL